MAPPTAEYLDEALVTLTPVGAPSDFEFRERRILLTKDKPTISIGRTSKRNVNYQATEHNAWFDSAVMSRVHAELGIDINAKKVYVKDIGSLHGTYRNDTLINPGTIHNLENGDSIKFGVPIDKGARTFRPCCLAVSVTFGTARPEDRPLVFRVPDDSDACSDDDEIVISDDSEEEDDDGEWPEEIQLEHCTRLLRGRVILPSASSPAEHRSDTPIDLTAGENSSPFANSTNATSVDEPSHADDNASKTFQAEDFGEVADETQQSAPKRGALVTDLGADEIAYDMNCSDWGEESYDSSSSEEQDAEEIDEGAGDEGLLPTEPDDFDAVDNFDTFADEGLNQLSSALEKNCDDEDMDGEAAEYTDGLATGMTQPEELPPFGLKSYGPSLNVRLPSIHETISGSMASVIPRQTPTRLPEDSVVALGEKTGKPEYFQAREQNKIRRLSDRRGSDPVRPPIQLRDWAKSPNPAENHEITTSITSERKVHHLPSESLDAALGSAVPELDETSAYQFELSKKAAGKAPEPKRTHVTINDIVEQAPHQHENQLKRKVAEMCQLTPEEAELELSSFQGTQRNATTVPQGANTAEPSVLADTTSALSQEPAPGSRPVKRLRRMAEVVGYAALGGVAVMSALIATAPSL